MGRHDVPLACDKSRGRTEVIALEHASGSPLSCGAIGNNEENARKRRFTNKEMRALGARIDHRDTCVLSFAMTTFQNLNGFVELIVRLRTLRSGFIARGWLLILIG